MRTSPVKIRVNRNRIGRVTFFKITLLYQAVARPFNSFK